MAYLYRPWSLIQIHLGLPARRLNNQRYYVVVSPCLQIDLTATGTLRTIKIKEFSPSLQNAEILLVHILGNLIEKTSPARPVSKANHFR
jgi:hypothetical protein